MNIDQILDNIFPLPTTSKIKIKNIITEVSYPKHHTLISTNKIETSIYLLKKGLVRAYANNTDQQITFWFGKEGDTIISLKSYVLNQKGYEVIETLETCELYELKVQNLQELFNEDIHIANWGRKLCERELIKTEERLISLQFLSATDRYKELLQNNPDLLRRVQLGHLASYLGVTQVTLSRIRAQK